MILKKITLHNWKNFQNCAVELTERCFIIGANASGKSNFIDALRFLRDIAKQSGGLQSAVDDRGGITKIRCLAARKQSNVSIAVELGNPREDRNLWRYRLDFSHVGGGVVKNQVRINKEEVLDQENLASADVIVRPDVGAMSAADLEHAYQTIDKGLVAAKDSLKSIKMTIIDKTQEKYLFE